MDIREEFRKSAKTAGKEVFFKPLYWSHWKTSEGDIHPHTHPYWQLEFILEGEIQVRVEEQDYWLHAGDAMLIPPMRHHTFFYLAENARESWSLKFDFGGFPEGLRERLLPPGKGLVAECAKSALDAVRQLHAHYATTLPLLDALIRVLLLTLYPHSELQAGASPLLQKLKGLLETLPYTELKARRLARECSYSADHLSVLVKETTGLPLKAFISREFQLRAERLLAYSHDTIGKIADRLGFPDQYAFSHFFHKNAGVSPSAYRRALGSAYFPEEYF